MPASYLHKRSNIPRFLTDYAGEGTKRERPSLFLRDAREARLRINGLLLARIHDQPQVPVFIYGQ